MRWPLTSMYHMLYFATQLKLPSNVYMHKLKRTRASWGLHGTKARQRDTFVSCPPIFKKWWGKFSFLIIHYFFHFHIKKNQYLTQLVGWFLLNSKSCKRRHIPQLGVDPKCWIEFNNHLISQLFMILLIDGPKNVDKTGWLLISSWNKVLVSTACYMYL